MDSTASTAHTLSLDTFLARWTNTTASELATAQSFVMDLCELLGVDKPHGTPEPSAVQILVDQEDQQDERASPSSSGD